MNFLKTWKDMKKSTRYWGVETCSFVHCHSVDSLLLAFPSHMHYKFLF